MGAIRKLIQRIREWRCRHVYIDLQKSGQEACVFCDKQRKK